MNNILDNFKLGKDQDDFEKTIESITKGVAFRGTNLWILIFAILVASIGLNVNATAVIIGAMLISPLMGPIMGVGLGLGINDIDLVKNALRNFGFAVLVSIATSTLYFSLSPLGEAQSELLSRITPTIWDVLIAFFGGLAGIIAGASKEKGNVIPGVAIATALMPPLCTAGYGIAHLDWHFFLGAFYLFLINSVFISLATLLTVRFLKFPIHHYADSMRDRRVQRWIYVIVIITVAPSVYIAYKVVQQNQFTNEANTYINNETTVTDNILLTKKVDAAHKTITLTFVGKGLAEKQKNDLKERLIAYKLQDASLVIKEGFSMKALEAVPDLGQKYLATIADQQKKIGLLQSQLDSIKRDSVFVSQLIKEAKAEHPALQSVSFSPILPASSGAKNDTLFLAYLKFSKLPDKIERGHLEAWLKVKFNREDLQVIYDK